MSNWDDFEYDDHRPSDGLDLARYLAEKEAELAERESRLRDREKEALTFYHDAEAKLAADAARWRSLLGEITPSLSGAEILGLFQRHGLLLSAQ